MPVTFDETCMRMKFKDMEAKESEMMVKKILFELEVPTKITCSKYSFSLNFDYLPLLNYLFLFSLLNPSLKRSKLYFMHKL